MSARAVETRGGTMHRTLLVALSLLLLCAPAARASDMTDAEVLELAGPRTCKDGYFPYIDEREATIPIFTMDPGILYEFCFKLKKIRKKQLGVKTNGLVQLQTANLGNTSCGTMSAFMIKPNRKSIFGPGDTSPRTYANLDASQPAGVLTYTPGIWRVLFRYESGCNKYSVVAYW
jgi:hypothetical protein